MSSYTKLHNSLLASTIWREDDKTRLVWITLLVMTDRHGLVEGERARTRRLCPRVGG